MRERHSRSAARHRNDPTQAAPILAEVYVLHVSIKVAGGPGRKATVRTSSCHLPSRLAGEPQVPDRRYPHLRDVRSASTPIVWSIPSRCLPLSTALVWALPNTPG
jgi:hypothetical protein